jgi:hypothetical protein
MFRFTIRDVLLVMVIVGLAVGWSVDRWRLDRARSEAVRDASYLAFHLHNGIIRGGDSAMEVEQLLNKYQVWKAAKSPNRP